MTRLRARLGKLEQHHKATAPEPHDRCLGLFQARQWAGQTAVLECFLGDAADCPHRAWADYCQRRDAQAAELFQLVGIEEAQGSGPPLSPEEVERQAAGVATLTAIMTAPLERLEAKLAAVKGRER